MSEWKVDVCIKLEVTYSRFTLKTSNIILINDIDKFLRSYDDFLKLNSAK